MKEDTENTILLSTLERWGRIAFDSEEFVEKFCPRAEILTSVSWDSENMRFVYILNSGEHIGDSVKITEWLEFINKEKS